MRKIAYLDCFSGISGDMTLGALIDLGVPLNWLKKQLTSLPLTGVDIIVETISKNGIGAKNVIVKDVRSQGHRNYSSITTMIEKSDLPSSVKKTSQGIFERIARAESHIHGCSMDDVHFHEVGATDAIVDIVGACLGFHYLNIHKVVCSKLPLGTGFVNCMHGQLPLPAPATLEILKGIPVYGVDVEIELVTPTGAGIATGLAEKFGDIPDMVIEKTGYGSGKNNAGDRPNLLRIVVGIDQGEAHIKTETIEVLQTCIDDMNPEIFGYLMETLFEKGALDVNYQPILMKKSRPGTKVEVVCLPEDANEIIKHILFETTTTGVRRHATKRSVLDREHIQVETELGTVRAKKITLPDGQVRMTPEYEDCRAIAIQENLPIFKVYDLIGYHLTKT